MSDLPKTEIVEQAITEFAKALYARGVHREWVEHRERFAPEDAVLRQLFLGSVYAAHEEPGFSELVALVYSEPELQRLRDADGESPSFVSAAGSGLRMTAGSMLSGLFSTAAARRYLLGLPDEESVLVELVLQAYGHFKAAAGTGRVPVLFVSRINGIILAKTDEVLTPWGRLRPIAGRPGFHAAFGVPETTCVLVEERTVAVQFDRSAQPRFVTPEADRPIRSIELLSLMASLASLDVEKPAAARLTWSTVVVPCIALSSYSFSTLRSGVDNATSFEGRTDVLKAWADKIGATDRAKVDLAASRLRKKSRSVTTVRLVRKHRKVRQILVLVCGRMRSAVRGFVR